MVKIKICGFTRRQDIEEAVRLGIRYVGINFFPPSPRFVKPAEASKLLADLPEDVAKVGVFVNPDEKFLFRTAKVLRLDAVQLHGNEPPWLAKKVMDRFRGEKLVIKAVRVENEKSLENVRIYKADYILLDSSSGDTYGGTGRRIDYSLLGTRPLPWERIFLAGGITAENVADVLARFKPFAIDVASGVEMAPGIKDREKMELLVHNTRKFYENNS